MDLKRIEMDLIYEDVEQRHYFGTDTNDEEVTLVFERPFCDDFPPVITVVIKET